MPSLVNSLHPAISQVRPMKSSVDSSHRTKCGFPNTGNGPGGQIVSFGMVVSDKCIAQMDLSAMVRSVFPE